MKCQLTKIAFSFVALVLSSCSDLVVVESSSTSSTPTLTPLWELAGPFVSPESAIYDVRRKAIYMSNVAGYEENGLGYISAISIDGVLIHERWIEGVNAPTGMAIDGDTLYVADFNRLVEIDIPSASIRHFYDVPDANPGLNDVTISPSGDVFISASAVSTIYRLGADGLEEWVKSDELEHANGLYADEQYIYVAGYYLRQIDINSREITHFGDDELLVDLESIETDGADGFFVTMIGVRPIMHISSEGDIVELLSRNVFTADIDYVADENLLVAPSGGNVLSAFSVE